MWPEAETPLSLSLRPFSLGVSRWLSVLPALLRWLTSLLSPPPPPRHSRPEVCGHVW